MSANDIGVDRDDIITAAGACALAAAATRRDIGRRRNAGPGNAAHRAWLRDLANQYEATGRRLQRAADEAA